MTIEGAKTQLLNIIVSHEQMELERSKQRIFQEGTVWSTKLFQCEENILETLSMTKGNILENKHAVDVLKDSKKISDEIKVKQKRSRVIERKLDQVRTQYTPLAEMAQRLYFVVCKLSQVKHFYSFSLQWFEHLLKKSLSNDRAKEGHPANEHRVKTVKSRLQQHRAVYSALKGKMDGTNGELHALALTTKIPN